MPCFLVSQPLHELLVHRRRRVEYRKALHLWTKETIQVNKTSRIPYLVRTRGPNNCRPFGNAIYREKTKLKLPV